MSLDLSTPEGQVMVNLPPNVGLTINGVTITATGVLALPEVNGSVPLALWWIFRALESDNMQSETIGKYSYSKWKMKASDYWKLQASSDAMSDTAPDVLLRPPPTRGAYPCY